MVETYSNHNLSNPFLTLCFYNGLDEATRSWVDYGALTTGGHLLNRSHESALYLLNDMVNFDYHWHWDPSLQGWSHQYPPYISHPDIINQPFEHQEEKKMRLEEAMAELGNAMNHFMEWTKNFKVENLMKFEPLEEIEPQDEDIEALDVVLAQTLAKMDAHVIEIDLHLLSDATSITSHELCDAQIASMVLDSQMEREEHFKWMLEEFLQVGEVQESLQDVEAHETIDLSSSMALLYIPPNDPFWPSS
ncbi:hypothetical protein L484_026849 [Morus notabilis]|uniref:Uncharacterized protein n=1 Tax=Morus notabilis TaxID=981085 RepID=W9RGK9_9ROSA|nr:hypothetical protein L484_026849 [Morus notabilis]